MRVTSTEWHFPWHGLVALIFPFWDHFYLLKTLFSVKMSKTIRRKTLLCYLRNKSTQLESSEHNYQLAKCSERFLKYILELLKTEIKVVSWLFLAISDFLNSDINGRSQRNEKKLWSRVWVLLKNPLKFPSARKRTIKQ